MLTVAQNQALKSDIAADPAFEATLHNSDWAFAVAAAYNLDAAPAFYVFRSSVPIDEIMGNGFDWARVDNLLAGKARIWEWMAALGQINAAHANVRAGILAVFTTLADKPMRESIFGHSQRLASRVEKLLATGAGTTINDQGVGPATMGFEGTLSYFDVMTAWGS